LTEIFVFLSDRNLPTSPTDRLGLTSTWRTGPCRS
jgi:hypothetical protein